MLRMTNLFNNLSPILSEKPSSPVGSPQAPWEAAVAAGSPQAGTGADDALDPHLGGGEGSQERPLESPPERAAIHPLLHDAAAQTRQAIEALDRYTSETEQALAQLLAASADQDARLAELEAELALRDERIGQLEREREIAKREEREARDRRIEALEEELKQAREEAEANLQELDQLHIVLEHYVLRCRELERRNSAESPSLSFLSQRLHALRQVPGIDQPNLVSDPQDPPAATPASPSDPGSSRDDGASQGGGQPEDPRRKVHFGMEGHQEGHQQAHGQLGS